MYLGHLKEMRYNKTMKKAFTLMELIFVIIVIAILSAVMIPNFENNSLKQAAQQVAADIRYTQHLAMINDRYNPQDLNGTGSVKWYKTRWQILFSANAGSAESNGGTPQVAYTVFSDNSNNSTGNPDESEVAFVPGNPSHRMTGGYNSSNTLRYWHANFVGLKRMNLGIAYSISSVSFSGTCGASTRLAFDYIGRPIKGNLRFDTNSYMNSDLLTSDCNITLAHDNGDTIILTVKPETGYVKVNY